MKSTCCLLCLVAGLVVLTGCGKDNAAPPPPPAPTVAPAPAPAPQAAEPATPPPAPVVRAAPTPTPSTAASGYLGALAGAQRLAAKTVDLSSLNQECQLFNTQEGRYPKDLNELVTMGYIGKLPAAPVGMKLVYDASQGKVTAVPQ